ncbi:MAG: hypothetical protein JXR15_08655 [Shimia sp.]|uniref:hypothetical protein n=1 Tax=Shimia sp. TaxID=1954381 RepID=UPI003B8E5C81
MVVVSLDFSVRNDVTDNWAILLAATATIIAGVGGGVLAWKSAQRQVENQNRLAEQDNQRSLLAARAALPPVLASLNSKAKIGFANAADFETQKSWEIELKKESVENSSISRSEIAVLQDCIKFADPISARWLSLIVAHFQIRSSRLERNLAQIGLIRMEWQVADDAMNWRVLSAMIDHMFEFSRTGKIPDEVLSENAVSLPVDIPPSKLTVRDWDKAFSRKMKRVALTGGWASKNFQSSLLNEPSNGA